MHTIPVRVVACLLAAVGVTALAGCSESDRTDGPADPSVGDVTVFSDARIGHLADACGTLVEEPSGDVSFSAELDAVAAEDMDLLLAGSVTGGGGGTHRPLPPEGAVADGDGVVVGYISGTGATTDGELDGDAAVDVTWTVRLSACDAELGSAFPDGTYELDLFGRVSALDHDHDQQEYWDGPTLSITVAEGALQL